MLGAIAERDPVAYCLAVSVAEGLPGCPSKPLITALAKRGIVGSGLAAHKDIDERLDHALVTRRLMQHIPWVESDAASRSIRQFLFVVELSQLCWRQLANYAEADVFSTVPVAFGMSARQVLDTFV